MPDYGLVIDGALSQVWRSTTRVAVENEGHSSASIIEIEAGDAPGMLWDGEALRPAPVVAPQPTIYAVRAEASRRMQRLVGARDAAHLDLILKNGTREAVRLLRIGAINWTPEEAARAAMLETVDAQIEAIRAASNALEALDQIPADYAADSRWP